MNLEEQLKLQALLDGELPPAEARDLAAALERDPAAAALLAELKSLRQTLHSAEPPLALPASREFFWSKIERDIQQLAPRPQARPVARLFNQLRLLILPAAVAMVLIIVGLAGHFYPPPVIHKKTADADTPAIETALASTDATTYRDASEGTTLVWFSDTTRNAPAIAPTTNRPN